MEREGWKDRKWIDEERKWIDEERHNEVMMDEWIQALFKLFQHLIAVEKSHISTSYFTSSH